MIIERFKKNPILTPDKNQSLEAEAVFNGCPVRKGNNVFLLYRAVSLIHYHTLAKAKLMVSDIGIAESKDGLNFYDRKRFIFPEHEWERFGCEDPRITKLDNKYYIFYTALSSWPPRTEHIKVGLAISKDLKTIEKKHLITPFNAKAMALFPEKINGKIWAVLTVHTDRPPAHIEVGSPPIKTKHGWLLFYSYIWDYISPRRSFSIESVLLDLKNPFKIIGKTDFPLLSPEDYYEKHGIVPNVVFPSGALLNKNTISLYYGAADTTCAVAFIDLPSLIDKFIKKQIVLIKLRRANINPIITPNKNHPWEAKATFNPAAMYLKGKVHLLYRAMSEDNTSVLGYAT